MDATHTIVNFTPISSNRTMRSSYSSCLNALSPEGLQTCSGATKHLPSVTSTTSKAQLFVCLCVCTMSSVTISADTACGYELLSISRVELSSRLPSSSPTSRLRTISTVLGLAV